MRCYCCNHILTTQETNRRFRESGQFTEMCNTCLNTIDGDGDDATATEDGAYGEKEEDDDS